MDLSAGFVEDSMQRYFDSLKNSTEKDIVQIAEDVGSWLKAYIEDYYDGKRTLEEPNACPGEDNNFMLTWNTNDWYLELELSTNGTGEWFCKETIRRQNDKRWLHRRRRLDSLHRVI